MIAKISLMAQLCPRIKQRTNQSMGFIKPPILLFFLFLCFVFAAKAQEIEVHSTPVAKAVTSEKNKQEIIPLKVGDTIPDELWEMYFPVVSTASEQEQFLSLGDFKDKLIVLDFWATWCSACINSLHKLDTLQAKFKDGLMVIPTSYEPENKVRPFLNKQGISLPSLIGEDRLKMYFPHRVVPHQVWLKGGKVYAITSHNESTEQNIRSILQNTATVLKEKRDLIFDPFVSIDVYTNERNAEFEFKSILTGRIEGIGNQGVNKNDSLWVQFYLNRPVLSIYKTVLEIPYNRMLLEVNDATDYLYDSSKKENYKNIVSYQLFMPPNTDKELLRAKVMSDLDTHLGLASSVQYREVECNVIRSKKEIKDKSVFKSKTEYNFVHFMDLLNHYSSWKPNMDMILNETGYHGPLIGKITPNEMGALKEDLPALEKYLAQYGFTVHKEKRTLPFFILTECDNYLEKLKDF